MELLVVIAIIAILASLLSVALVSAKIRARATYCLNNKKQLALISRMYTEDQEGKLVANRTIDDAAPDQTNEVSWVRQSMRWSNTNDVTPIMLSRFSLFSPYLAGNLKAYKCPEDNYYTAAQKSLNWKTRPRSVGMNNYLGCDPYKPTLPDMYNYKILRRESDFVRTSPAEVYSIIDVHPDSFEMNYGAVVYPPSLQLGMWEHFPATWHGRAATMSFCDGHAVIKKWLEPSTVQPVLFEGLGDSGRGNSGLPLTDMLWVAQRTSEPLHYPTIPNP